MNDKPKRQDAPQSKYTQEFKDKFREVFKKSVCNISYTCEKMNIDRQTFYNYCKDIPEFKSMVEDARESMVDMAETMLYKNVKDQHQKAIEFVLTNKRFGQWKNKQEVSGDPDNPIGIEISFINSATAEKTVDTDDGDGESGDEPESEQ